MAALSGSKKEAELPKETPTESPIDQQKFAQEMIQIIRESGQLQNLGISKIDQFTAIKKKEVENEGLQSMEGVKRATTAAKQQIQGWKYDVLREIEAYKKQMVEMIRESVMKELTGTSQEPARTPSPISDLASITVQNITEE
jgi:hypothetical protein